MADMKTNQDTAAESPTTEADQPLNRAERRAQRKGRTTNPQQRQFGVGPEPSKGSRDQVMGPRQFNGRRGDR